jgi:hypothetical protein
MKTTLTAIAEYIERRNRELYRDQDRFADFVTDAFGRLNNSTARLLLEYLDRGEHAKACDIISECIIREYGEKI